MIDHHIVVAGIDIAKDRLDVALHPQSQITAAFPNTPKGIASLIAWLAEHRASRAVFEPTGPFHQPLERALAPHLEMVKVNPRNARRFAEASGRLAKTDKADAATLATMGAVMTLRPTKPTDETLTRMRALLTARRGLIADQTATKNRAANAVDPLIQRQIKRRLKALQRDIEEIDAALKAAIESDGDLRERYRRLTSVPGIGPQAARALIIDMPELGTLSSKEAASLAGLAPLANDSGRQHGRRFIRGGRFQLRRSLYMGAVAASRSHSVLGETYRALRAAGKPAKVALVALMRKIVIIANAILRDNTIWQNRAA